MMKLAKINAMAAEEFVANFGDIAEHSLWVTEAVAKLHPSPQSGEGGQRPDEVPFSTRVALLNAFVQAVLTAPEAKQLSLLRAHPDLATKAKLTADSTNEQKGAGLDTLSIAELAKFTALNNQYKEQNGFPFIFAVKGATKHQILESFEQRIHNARDEEFQVALAQVCKIIGFRLEARVEE